MPLLKELEFTGLIKEYLPAGERSGHRSDTADDVPEISEQRRIRRP